ncbi:tyrosine-type recombinase/integrase [Sphingomonas sp. 3-13AW]|uniref:tyrosine-type recombinase/integrase n=1 Tax=Sphingomonas sp. 3-13AW TaxID=3050450 RepID=UPI003BB49FD4
MLTNATVKTARADARPYKMTDGQGLFLHVAPTGTKSFRMKFRIGGKEQLLTFGTWPEVSLAEARERRDLAREQLGRGEDPRTKAPAAAAKPSTFEDAGRAWHAHQRPTWTEVHAGDVMASLERDVFPVIGAMPLAAITPPVVLNALRVVESRGARETARRLRQRVSMIFAFAQSEGWCEHDPAAVIGRAMKAPGRRGQQPALTELDDVRALLAEVDALEAGPSSKLASSFLALTAVRLAAVRGARWDEFEDLEGPSPLWRVPAARMKLAAAKKTDARHDHLVPLSPAAVEILRAARANMHPGHANMHDLVFPGRSGSRPIGEAAIGALYARTSFAGRHVPHGWRASYSTILNELFPEDQGAIDRALAHAPKDKVEAAYNRAQHLQRRRELFDAWADLLTGSEGRR